MNYRPFFSVLMIIGSLLTFTIGKMEQRRMGYLTLRLNQSFRAVQDERRTVLLQLARATRPERIDRWATSENLSPSAAGRVIAISGGRVALRQ
jgi:hypothetical protein